MSFETAIKIRAPRVDDIQGIVELVRTCEPFLSAHGAYLYWIYIQYCRETCAVAELAGEIIGWCSVIPVSSGHYFLHQLGIAPHARRLSLGKSLFTSVLEKLKARHQTFALEFTVDRRNSAALNLNRAVAADAGMQVTKKPDIVPSLEGSEEELYVMAFDRPRNHHAGVRSRDSVLANFQESEETPTHAGARMPTKVYGYR